MVKYCTSTQTIKEPFYLGHPVYQLYSALITKIDNKYKNFKFSQFQKTLIALEKKSGDYFGENLSDNSDSEEERSFQRMSALKKHLSRSYTNMIFERTQYSSALFTQKGAFRTNIGKYEKFDRQSIIPDKPYSEQVLRDLDRLNSLAIRGELNEETIKTLRTKFLIAQYRGICYRIDKWSQPARQQHRNTDEIGIPLCSRAVLAEAGYSKIIDYINAIQNNKAEIDRVVHIAENLQDQLLQLQLSGPIEINFTTGEIIPFANALLALQQYYSNSYDGFHALLKAFAQKFIHDHVVKLDTLKEAILLSIKNEWSLFYSTSDTPDHALGYAYGTKAYSKHRDARLKPRWHKDGTVERPYAGKVYVSLHDPLELYTRSHHVVSLHADGKINITSHIIHERETSFFAYIPGDKVISQHVAKFPAFKGEYKESYFEKYGLDKFLYEKFQGEIGKFKPNTNDEEKFEEFLAEHLKSYQEVLLIEEAKTIAKAKNHDSVLIYRNEFGGFSLYPCKQAENENSKDPKEIAVIQNKKAARAQNAEKHINSTNENFLNCLVQNYIIFSNIPIAQTNSRFNSLIANLAFLLESDKQVLWELCTNIEDESNLQLSEILSDALSSISSVTIRQFLNTTFKLLERVSTEFYVNIHLHSPRFEGSKLTIGNQKKEINLYYLGGETFSALRSIKDSQDLIQESHSEYVTNTSLANKRKYTEVNDNRYNTQKLQIDDDHEIQQQIVLKNRKT